MLWIWKHSPNNNCDHFCWKSAWPPNDGGKCWNYWVIFTHTLFCAGYFERSAKARIRPQRWEILCLWHQHRWALKIHNISSIVSDEIEKHLFLAAGSAHLVKNNPSRSVVQWSLGLLDGWWPSSAPIALFINFCQSLTISWCTDDAT